MDYERAKLVLTSDGLRAHLEPETICTPIPLVEEIVEKLGVNWENPNLKILDPACGRGAFLLVLKNKLLKYHNEQHVVENMLYGCDISQRNVDVSRMMLNRKYNNNIVCDNALARDWKMKFDVVVGNPPYSIPGEGEGRTAGTKLRLYARFFHAFYKNAPNYGVVLPSNWIGRDRDTVRAGIMDDPDVKYIFDTSSHFNDKINGTPTCAVIKCQGYNNTKKLTIIGTNEVAIEASDFVSFKSAAYGSLFKKLSAGSTLGSLWRRNVNTGVTRSCKLLTDKKTNFPVVLVTGAKDEAPTTGYIIKHVDQKDIDQWKVIINCNASPTSIGVSKIVRPGFYTTDSIVFFPASDEQRAKHIQQYLHSSIVTFFVKTIRNSHGNTQTFFSKVPLVDLSRSWTDAELYAHFGLTADEIALIESTIK